MRTNNLKNMFEQKTPLIFYWFLLLFIHAIFIKRSWKLWRFTKLTIDSTTLYLNQEIEATLGYTFCESFINLHVSCSSVKRQFFCCTFGACHRLLASWDVHSGNLIKSFHQFALLFKVKCSPCGFWAIPFYVFYVFVANLL